MKKLFLLLVLLFPLISFAQFNLDEEIVRLANKYHAQLDTCTSDSNTRCDYSRADLFALVKDKLKDNNDAPAILATIECESNFNPKIIGDHGDSLGLVQINLPSWPDISSEEALDPIFAMDFIIEQFKLGHKRYWTCYRLFAAKSVKLKQVVLST